MPVLSVLNRKHCWGVVLAGGDGTRLQSLTQMISGDKLRSSFVPSSVKRAYWTTLGNGSISSFEVIELCAWSHAPTRSFIALTSQTWTGPVSSYNL
jgi:hypothetical protein